MKVIKDNAILEDNWQLLREIAKGALPDGPIIVPFTYWRDNKEALLQRNEKLGVWIDGSIETEEVAKDVKHFDIIALDFPAFTDGRSYTHARLLRERFAYSGELRAVGDVLRDQLFFMLRCGIDSFALREDKDMEDALKAFKEFSVRYQTAADGAEPIYRYR